MDKKLLCKILKLSDNATDAEIEAKLNALATSEEKLTLSDGQGARALADVHAKVTKLEDSNKALAESNKQLGDKLSKLEGEKKAGEAKAFVDGLVKERKIQPVQTEAVTKLALSDLETAKAVYKDAKSFADTTEVGITGPAGDEPTGAQTLSLLDTEAAKLAKEHGLSLVDAKIRAMELNPKLAKAAASASR